VSLQPSTGRLPRRDLLLLPLVSLLTVVLMAGFAELACRVMFPADETTACRVRDPVLGYRNKPGCSDTLKAFEAERVVNQYNDCGYRSAGSCRPVPAGTSRVALIGSSVGAGHFVSYGDSLGTQIGERLAQECHRPIDVQNLSATEYYMKQTQARATEALKLKPDLLVWVLTPYDVQVGDSDPPTFASTAPSAPPPLLVRLHSLLLTSRAFAVGQHLYYEDVASYVPLFLLNKDKAGFLYRDYSPSWTERIATFGRIDGTIADAAKAAGVPLVVAFVPQRAQAALVKMTPPKGVDPYRLQQAVQRIVEQQGGHFVDATPALGRTPSPASLFLPLDGHLDGHGHRIVGRAIADQLVDAKLPGFSECSPLSSTASAAGTPDGS